MKCNFVHILWCECVFGDFFSPLLYSNACSLIQRSGKRDWTCVCFRSVQNCRHQSSCSSVTTISVEGSSHLKYKVRLSQDSVIAAKMRHFEKLCKNCKKSFQLASVLYRYLLGFLWGKDSRGLKAFLRILILYSAQLLVLDTLKTWTIKWCYCVKKLILCSRKVCRIF